MKRIFGFMIGALIGIVGVYALRRWLEADVSPQPQVAIRIPVAPISSTESQPQPSSSRHPEEPQTRTVILEEQVAENEPVIIQTSDQSQAAEDSSLLASIELSNDELATATSQSDALGSEPATHKDNFTHIKGIGEVTAQKLYKAGISTFAQLAVLTMEELEQKTDFSEARIRRDKIIEQAEELAKNQKQVNR
jgi:predicted flap endonuclease-1-like 5' DNA nuclease